ncbi:MAG TPA: efflux RND transporter permease subunit, partial [Spirochaetia bacterium]|nr:efflux RND transporter permease subunit [Spirochaetia bacterium]
GAYPIRLCRACREAIQGFPGSEEVYNAGSEALNSLIRIVTAVAFSFLLMAIAVHEKASVLRIMGGTLFSVLAGCSGLTLLGKPLTPLNLSSLAAGGVLGARSLSLVEQREGRKPSGIRSAPGLMTAFLLSVSAILLALLGKGEIALSLILPQIIALVATHFYGRLFERNRTKTRHSTGNTCEHAPYKNSHALLINLSCLAALVLSLVASQHLALDDRAENLSFSVEFESGLRVDEVEKRIRSFERWLSEREEVKYVASVCEDERARFDIRLEKRGVAESLYKECKSRSTEIQDGFIYREEETSGQTIDIVVTGSDREGLRNTAGKLGAALSRLNGVNEVVYRFKERKPVVSIELSPSRLSVLGLTVQEAAREIILACEGRVVSKVIGDREELDVRIVPSDTPRTLSSLGDTLIYPDGRELRLKDIARFSLEENYGPMYRFQKKRCVFFTVTSDLNSSGAARSLKQNIQGILDSHPYREGIRASIVEEESGQKLLPVILAALSLCAAMGACAKAPFRIRKIFLHAVLSAALPSLLTLFEPSGIAGWTGTATAIFCAVESAAVRRETRMSGAWYSGTEAIASCGIIPLILCIPEMRPFFSYLLSGLIGFRLFAALRGSIRDSCKKRKDLQSKRLSCYP